MTRIGLIDSQRATPEIRELYDRIEQNGAAVINLYRLIANSPGMLRDFIRYAHSLLNIPLDPRLRHMLVLRVANLTGAKYMLVMHTPVALELGVTPRQAAALADWQQASCFSPQEQAALQFADEVTTSVRVSEETFARLKKYFDEPTIAELTLVVAFYNMAARIMVPLELDIDEKPAGSFNDLVGK